jgi:REP element-mobilizing transposase RayT
MARPLRITFPGAFYHVTSRGNEQKAVFKSKRDREKFLDYLASATERYNAAVHAFCLMDNHYHLLLETPSANLPQIMRHINGAYTTYFNIKRGRSGHLFQGRYKAILVDRDTYAKELSRYIHLNPVRAHMAKTPGDYPWSSYNAYIGESEAPDWLQRDFILAYFGKQTATAQKRYREFVHALAGREYESPLAEASASLVLGPAEFIRNIKKRFLGNQVRSRDLPALRQIHEGIDLETVVDLVKGALRETPAHARNACIYLCRKHTGQTLRAIGQQFGISDAAVSQVCKRFKVRMKSDSTLRKEIAALEEQIKLLKVET